MNQQKPKYDPLQGTAANGNENTKQRLDIRKKNTTRKKMNKEVAAKTTCPVGLGETASPITVCNATPPCVPKCEAMKTSVRPLSKPKVFDIHKIKKTEETRDATSKQIKSRPTNNILKKSTASNNTISHLSIEDVTESLKTVDSNLQISTVNNPKVRDAQEVLSIPVKGTEAFQFYLHDDNSRLQISQENVESCESPKSYKVRSFSVPAIFLPPFDTETTPLRFKRRSYSGLFRLSNNSLASVPESATEDHEESIQPGRLSVSTQDISQYDSGNMSCSQAAGTRESAQLGKSKGLLEKRGLHYQGLSDSGHSGSLSASDISASGGDLRSRSWSSESDANWQSHSRYSQVSAIPEGERYCSEWHTHTDESWKRSKREEYNRNTGTIALCSESNEMAEQVADGYSESLEMHKYISASCPSLNRLPLLDNRHQQLLSVTAEAMGTNIIAQEYRPSVEESCRVDSNEHTHETPCSRVRLQVKQLLARDSENLWNRMKSGSESTLCQNLNFGLKNSLQRTATTLSVLQCGISLSMSKLHLQNSHESDLDKLHHEVSRRHHRSVDDVLLDHGHFRIVHFKAPEPNSRIRQWPTNLTTQEQKQEKKHSLIQSDEQGFRMTDIHFPDENQAAVKNDQIIQPLESKQRRDDTRNKSIDPTKLVDDWSRKCQDEGINEFIGVYKLSREETAIEVSENICGLPNLKEEDIYKERADFDKTDLWSGSDKLEINKTDNYLRRKADSIRDEYVTDSVQAGCTLDIKIELISSEDDKGMRNHGVVQEENIIASKDIAESDITESVSEKNYINNHSVTRCRPEINILTRNTEEIRDDLAKQLERKEVKENHQYMQIKPYPSSFEHETEDSGTRAHNDRIKMDSKSLKANANSDALSINKEILDHIPNADTTQRRVIDEESEVEEDRPTDSPYVHLLGKDYIMPKVGTDGLPIRDINSKDIKCSEKNEITDHLQAESASNIRTKDDSIFNFSTADVTRGATSESIYDDDALLMKGDLLPESEVILRISRIAKDVQKGEVSSDYQSIDSILKVDDKDGTAFQSGHLVGEREGQGYNLFGPPFTICLGNSVEIGNKDDCLRAAGQQIKNRGRNGPCLTETSQSTHHGHKYESSNYPRKVFPEAESKSNYSSQTDFEDDQRRHEFLINANQQKDSKITEARKSEKHLQKISGQKKVDIRTDQDGIQYSGQQCPRNSYRDSAETRHQQQVNNTSTDADDVMYKLNSTIPVIFEEDENRGSQDFYGGKEECHQNGHGESLEELQQESPVGMEEYGDTEDDECPADSDEDEFDVRNLNHEHENRGTCTTASCFSKPGVLNLTNFTKGPNQSDINYWDFPDSEPAFWHKKSFGTRFATTEDLSTCDVSDDAKVNFSATESVQSDTDEFSDDWLWRSPDWQKWLSASELEYIDPRDWYDGRSLSSDCILLQNRYATRAPSDESITYVIVGADIVWPIRRHHSVPTNVLMAQRSRQYAGDSKSNSQNLLNQTKRRKSLPGFRFIQSNFKNNSSSKATLQIDACEAIQKTDDTSNMSANVMNTVMPEPTVSCNLAQQVSENQNQETATVTKCSIPPTGVKKAQERDETLDREEVAQKDSVKQVAMSLTVSEADAFINMRQHKPNDLNNIHNFDRQLNLETCRSHDHNETRAMGKLKQHAEIHQGIPAGNVMKDNPAETCSKLSTERQNQCTQTTNIRQDLDCTPFSQLCENNNRLTLRTAFSQTDIEATSRTLHPYFTHSSLHGLHSNRTTETQTDQYLQDIETQTSPTFQNSRTQFNWLSSGRPTTSHRSDLHHVDGQTKTVSICSPLSEQVIYQAESVKMGSKDDVDAQTRYDESTMRRPFQPSSFEDAEVNNYRWISQSTQAIHIPSHVTAEQNDSRKGFPQEEIYYDIDSRNSYLDIKSKAANLQVQGICQSNYSTNEQQILFTSTGLDLSHSLREDAFSDKKCRHRFTLLHSNEIRSGRKNQDGIPKSENSAKNYNSACEAERIPTIYGETVHVLQQPDIKQSSEFQHSGSGQPSMSWKAGGGHHSASSSVAHSNRYSNSNEAVSNRNARYKINVGNRLTSVESARDYEERETQDLIDQRTKKAETDHLQYSYNYDFSKTSLNSKVNFRDLMTAARTATTRVYYPPNSDNKHERLCSYSQKGNVAVNPENSKHFSDSQKDRHKRRAESLGSNSSSQIGSRLTWAENFYIHSTTGRYQAQQDNNNLSENSYGFLKLHHPTQSDGHVKHSSRLKGCCSTREETLGIFSALPISLSSASTECSWCNSKGLQARNLISTKPCGSYSGSSERKHNLETECSRPKYKYEFVYKHHEKPQSSVISSPAHEYDCDEIERLRRERRRLIGLLVKDITTSKMRVKYTESQLNYQIDWTEQLLQEMNKDDAADFFPYITR